MFKILISFLVCFVISQTITAQVCTGSLGDPVINNTFGVGRNPGAALPVTSTTYPYVANSCPGDGFYTIANSTANCFGNSWHTIPEDHTPNDVAGYMMIVNASAAPGVFYIEPVNGLCGGTTYEFAAWILNVGIGSFCGGTPIHPDVTFSIETTTGTVLKSYNTGSIPFFATPTWKQYGTYFTTPAGITSVVVKMTNNAPGGCGNDLALDDITFRPCGPLITASSGGGLVVNICASDVNPIVFAGNVSAGYTNPYYQWQESTDNGITWTDIAGANTINYSKPPGAAAATYLYRLTVIETSNIGNAACKTVSNTVTLNVAPSPSTPSFIASAPDCITKTVTFTYQPPATPETITSWIWNFGDGSPVITASSGANQVHPYASAGSYAVTLQVQGSGACLSTVFSMTVVIPSSPAFDFKYNDTCVNQPVQFSTAASGTYSWDFGDLTNSTIQNPVKSYTSSGSYTIILQVTFAGGCTGSVSHPIIIGTLPVLPAFAIAPAAACTNQNVTFTDQSSNPTGSVTQWIWNFGDGPPVILNTNAPQIHTYSTAGNYTITLQVKGVGGCLSPVSSSQVVISAIPATPLFNAVSTACLNTPVTFTDVPQSPAGSITQWVWNFGEGPIVTAATNAVQTHTYTVAGTYNVTLQVTGAGGCLSTVFSQPITITTAPAVDFTFVAGCLNTITTFAVTNPGPSGTQYSWTFGDGNMSALPSPTNTYNTAGTYNVILTVNYAGGCTGSKTKPVIVKPAPALPSFTAAPAAACVNQQLVFNGQSTNTAASIAEWNWSFGDGSPVITAATNTPQPHTYATPNTYTVTLQLKDTGGCLSSIATNQIVISPIPATPSFTAVAAACILQPVTFTDVPVNPAGSITQWAWNFGDGSPPVMAVTNAVQTHSYTVPGTYNVTLQLTGVGGCISAVFTKPITITNAPPVDFTYVIGCAKTATTFTVTNPGPAGTVYNWTFGDGNLSGQTNPSNTYAAGGAYNVTLAVLFAGGCSGSNSHTVIIAPLPATPSFTAVPSAVCINKQVVFTGQSSDPAGTIVQWIWNFGDGSAPVIVATNVPQSHTYTIAGTYTVTLQVKGAGGCLSTVFSKQVIISPIPVTPSFNAVAAACINQPVTFTDVPTNPAGSITQWVWNFGDGSPVVSAGTNAVQTHTYTIAGTYNVILQLTGTGGCVSAVFTRPVTITSPPAVNFTFVTGCLNAATTFTVTNPGPAGTQYSWTFGDGHVSAQANPSNIYTVAGTYNVALAVNFNGGCTGNNTGSVVINPLPALPAFTTPVTTCTGKSVTVINQTPNTSGSIAQWVWNFGDGSPIVTATTAVNQTHTYSAAGTFTISLQVRNTKGCVSPVFSQVITVGAIPAADFTFTNSCEKNPLQFTTITNAGSGSVFAWTFGDATTSALQNPSKTYSAGGSYPVNLIVTTALNCTATVNHTVVVAPAPPTPSFTAFSLACINKPVTFVPQALIPPGVVSWQWNFGDGSPAVVAGTNISQVHSYSAAGNYNVTLQLTGTGGCVSNVFTLPFTIAPNPTADFSFINSCENTPVNFTATTNGIIQQWKFGDGGVGTAQNPIHTYITGGNYNAVLIVRSAAGCTDSVKKVVVITSKPVVNFTVSVADTICSDLPVSILNNTTAAGPVSFIKIYWNWPDNADTTGDRSPAAGKSYSHIYPSFHTPVLKKAVIKMVANTGSSCEAEKFDTVYLKAIPDLAFDFASPSCEGDEAFLITTARDRSGMTGQYSFSGPGVSTQGIFNPKVAGTGSHTITYYYTASDGCAGSIDGVVTVAPKPQISAGSDKATKAGEKVLLTATSRYLYVYTWSPAATLSNSTVLQPFASPVMPMVYTLTAVSSQGCITVDSVFVQILKDPVIPNVFSPNHDGVNDTWVLKNLSLYSGCTIEIFNRYGGKVYSSLGYTKPWDGTYNNNPLPVGVYYYIIKPDANSKPLAGWVTLLR